VLTVLDSDNEPMRLGVEAEPFLVTPNQAEAESLVGQEFNDEDDLRVALEAISDLGARNVLITTDDGCVASLREDREPRRFRVTVPGRTSRASRTMTAKGRCRRSSRRKGSRSTTSCWCPRSRRCCRTRCRPRRG
jgi:hypothetical protein